MQKKIGLYFGSFNPVHTGHLIIAESIIEEQKLDEIWFVVSPHNPKKEYSQLAAESLRLEMVQLAIQNNKRFKVCDVEFFLSKPSYTINTLNYLTNIHPDLKFEIIIGSDNLQSFDQWKSYEEIRIRFPLLVYPRIGFSIPKELSSHTIFCANLPYLNISSTYIRTLIQKKQSIRYLVPDNVMEYIYSKIIYATSTSMNEMNGLNKS